MNSDSQITEIETDDGTLYIDTETKESVLVEDEKKITQIDVEGGTLYVDTETHESIFVEDSDSPDDTDPDPTAVVA